MASLREEIESRRTFAIISHPDAGKTTLTEKLLLYGGAIQTAGSVKGKQSAKHAVSDWMDIEKQRGISVTSSVLQFNYQGKCINILDTPGHQDFSEDTYRTLMAADSAVMVIDAAKGVEAQTIKLFKVCTLRHIPIFTFINKMDREARDPFELMENIEEILGIKTYPMNWPISCGKDFKGVYDRNAGRVLAFESDGRANGVKMVEEVEAELGDARLDDLIGAANHEKLAEDIELLTAIREAGQEVYINIHPGAHVGQGTETGCRLISEGLNQVFERTTGVMVLLETMAGKGTECGRNFEELATIMNGVENKANVGVTFDTCHVLDAGYDLENDYDGVMRQLDEAIGLARVKAIHVNDSQFGLGSHKDRHANIGQGQLGIPFFTRLVNDPTMAKLPMILETKEQTPTTHRDEIALLRGLVD